MKLSVKYKLIISVFLVLVGVDGFMMWYFPRQQKRQHQKSFENELTVLSQTLSLAVGIGLSNDNYGSIGTAFDFAKQDSSILYIAIVDGEGSILSYPDQLTQSHLESIKKVGNEEILRFETSVVSGSPIYVDEELYGYVALEKSLALLHEEIADGRTRILVVCLIALLLSAVITYFITASDLAQKR